jgi:hypothetical protein
MKQPRQSGVRGLGHRTLYIKVKYRLRTATSSFCQASPSRIARTGSAISICAIAHELDGGVVCIRRPVVPKVVEERIPIMRQAMSIEVLTREREPMVDSCQHRPLSAQLLTEPSRHP